MNVTFPHERSRSAVGVAILVGVVGVAGSYAIAGATQSFVVAPMNSLVVDLMPAQIIAFSILVLGEVGDLIGFLLAIVLAVAAIGFVTLAAFGLGRRYGAAAALGTAYFGGWGFALLLTHAPWASLGVALPIAVAVGLVGVRPLDRIGGLDESRRAAIRLIGAGGFAGLAYAAGNRAFAGSLASQPPRLSVIPTDEQAKIKSLLDRAATNSLDVRGIDGLVSPVNGFYVVDVDSIDPGIDAEEWTLTISGAVDNERTIRFDDLTTRSPEHRFNTLRCVGEPLNGQLMDNALWTGVPVSDLLSSAGVSPAATHVQLRAADGYYESFPIEALQDGFLAYGINGHLLPRAHGYPVRALVPGHWGEVNVKWLTAIRLVEREADSYWEQRGWHGTGPVNTVTKIHARNHLPDGRIQVGGHAYAGTRGVSAVEVSTDGGQTWNDATLSGPLPGEDVWRQWAYTYDPPAGPHQVVARAIDGGGTVQPRNASGAFPSGASGWVSVRVTP